MNNKQLSSITLFVLLIISSFTIGCIENNQDDKSTVILNIISDDYSANYTLKDLEMMESYSGTGGYIKTGWLPDIVLSDIVEYTGVRITTLLDEIANLPANYNISILSSDGYPAVYTKNETIGYVDVYNDEGGIIQTKTAVMIIAYMKNNSYYSEIDPENKEGPLRIAFVGDDVITSSSLWAKMVVSIEIITL